MSGSTRSRQKRKLEPISIEELAGTTGMSGFCTFLTRDTSVPVPALDGLSGAASEVEVPTESGAPVIDAPESTAPVSSAPGLTAPGLGAPVSGALNSDALARSRHEATGGPDSGALEPGAVESSAPDSIRRRIRVREAATVQDGHSLAEQAVYDAMYRAGKPYQGDSRVLTHRAPHAGAVVPHGIQQLQSERPLAGRQTGHRRRRRLQLYRGTHLYHLQLSRNSAAAQGGRVDPRDPHPRGGLRGPRNRPGNISIECT